MKAILDVALGLLIYLPAFILSYLWQCWRAGWAGGEWIFSPKSFHAKYGGEAELETKVKEFRKHINDAFGRKK